jgi:hypothetical protein
MAGERGSNLLRRLADPTLDDHVGMKLPIGRRVVASSQLAHLAFFSFILRGSRFQLLGHRSAPLSVICFLFLAYHQ